MTDAEIMTMAIRMIKLERFRVKKLKDIKDGFYVRLFSSGENHRAGLVRLHGKPMTNRTFKRRLDFDNLTGNIAPCAKLQSMIDAWMVVGSRAIPETDGVSLPRDSIYEQVTFVDDFMTSANAYRLNSKVQQFAEDWNRLSNCAAFKIWRIYLQNTSRKDTFNLDY